MAAGTGHVIDSSTRALWRFEEGGGRTLVDATGNYAVLNSTNYIYDRLDGRVGKCRTWSGSAADFFYGVASASEAALFKGNWTLEMWVRLDPDGTGVRDILGYSGGGSAGDTHLGQAELRADYATGKLTFTWHSGGDTVADANIIKQSLTSTSGLLKGLWYHVTLRKSAEDGGTWKQEILINGVLDAVRTGVPNSAGGNACLWRVGIAHGRSGSVGFDGELDDTRFSIVARSDAEVLASYQRGLASGKDTHGYGHEVDSNTLLLFRFNEVINQNGNGVTEEVGGQFYAQIGAIALSNQGTGKLPGTPLFGGGIQQYVRWRPDILPHLRSADHGASFEGWIKPYLTGEAYQSLFQVGASGGTQDEAANTLFHVYLDRANARLGADYRTGNFVRGSYIDAPIGSLKANVWQHVAVTRQFAGPNVTWKLYLGGRKILEKTEAAALPTGATNSTCAITSSYYNGNLNNQLYFSGDRDDFRFSKVARTDDEIWASFTSMPPQAAGLALDRDTLALWRCNESAVTDPLFDERGSCTLAHANSPGVLAGKKNGARSFNGSQWFSGLATQLERDAFSTGDCTWEGWLYLDSGYRGGSDYTMVCSLAHVPSGLFTSGADTYRLPSLTFARDSGIVYLSWTTGVAPQAYGNLPGSTYCRLVAGAWTHYAFSKKNNGDGTSTFKTYGNGKLIATATVNNTWLTPPSTPHWVVGRQENQPLYFMGRVDDIRVSSVVRSEAEITATYLETLPRRTRGMKHDVDTLALWRMDDYANRATCDDVMGTYPLTVVGSVPQVSGQVGFARSFNGNIANRLRRTATDAALLASLRDGDWTAEAWVKPTAAQAMYVFAMAGNGETEVLNNVACLIMNANRTVGVQWEFSAGSDVVANSSGMIPLNAWSHVAAVKRRTPGTLTFEVWLYINGVLDSVTKGLTAATGGSSSILNVGGYADASAPWLGVIDEVRLSSRARSAGEIAESHGRGATPLPLSDLLEVEPSTLASYRLVEEGVGEALFDEAGNLSLGTSSGTAPNRGFTQKGSNGLGYTGNVVSEALNVALCADFTYEAWLYIPSTYASAPTGYPGLLTSDDNVGGTYRLLGLQLERATGMMGYNYTVGSGGWSNYLAVWRPPYDVWFHFAFRKTMSGGSTVYEMFCNGERVMGSSPLGNPTYRAAALMTASQSWYGGISDIVLSAKAKTQDEIRASVVRRPQPSTGHLVDGDTVALWRMDEQSGSAYSCGNTGLLPLTPVGTIQRGDSIVEQSLAALLGSGQHLQYRTIVSSEHTDYVLGNYTVEMWLRADGYPSQNATIPFALGYGNSRWLQLDYAPGTGWGISYTRSGVLYSATLGVPPVLEEWAHWAVRKTIENPGQADIYQRTNTYDLFKNGVKVATRTGVPQPEGALAGPNGWDMNKARYTLGSYGLPGENTTPTYCIVGALDDVRVSKKARSDAEIVESFRRRSSPLWGDGTPVYQTSPIGHAVDGSTRLRWRLDEENGTDPAADETGSYPLTTVVGTPAVVTGKWGKGRNFAGTSYLKGPADQATVTKVKAGGWTIEFWLYINNIAGTQGLFNLSEPDGSSPLIYAKTWDATGLIYWGSDGGNGSNEGQGGQPVPVGQWVHIAFVRDGDMTVRWYVNGVQNGGDWVQSRPTRTLTNPTWFLGTGERGADNGLVNANVRIDDFRFSNVMRSAAEIAANAAGGTLAVTPFPTALYDPGPVLKASPIVSVLAPRGLDLDTDTLALWRFDERTHVPDEVGGESVFDVTLLPLVPTPWGALARDFNGTSHKAWATATDSQRLPLVSGAHTLEVWCRPLQPPAGGAYVVTLTGPAGDAVEAENILTYLTIHNDGGLNYFIESGLGVNSSAVTGPGFLNKLWGTWVHLACTLEPTGGGNAALRLYVNGRLLVSSSGKVPTGGGPNTHWYLSQIPGDTAAWFKGALAEVRVSKKARTQDELFTAWKKGVGYADTERGFTLDKSTLALWRLDDTADKTVLKDEGGLIPMTLTGSIPPVVSKLDIGRNWANPNVANRLTAAGDPATLTLLRDGDCSIEAWVHVPNLSAIKTIFSYTGLGSDLTEAGNGVFSLAIMTNGALRLCWEYAGDVDVNILSNANDISVNRWHHVAATKTKTGSTCTGRIYLNGVLVAEATNQTAPTGGTTANVCIGHWGTTSEPWQGLLDEVRVSTAARTPEEIRASYERGMARFWGTPGFELGDEDGVITLPDGEPFTLSGALSPQARAFMVAGKASTDYQYIFATDTDAVGGGGPVVVEPLELTLTIEDEKLRVQSDESVEYLEELLDIERYLVSGPLGAPEVKVLQVEAFDSHILLTLSDPKPYDTLPYKLYIESGLFQSASGRANKSERLAFSGWYELLTGATLENGRLRVQFASNVLDTSTLRDTSRYSLSVPVGAPELSVTGVEVHAAHVLLTLSSSELIQDAYYEVTLAAGTARLAATGAPNLETSLPFLGVGVKPEVLSVSPRYEPAQKMWAVRVVFSEKVRMGSALSAGSALNPNNYSITHDGGSLGILSVEKVSDTVVDLITLEQDDVPYSLTIQNILDPAGNEVA